MFLPSIVTAPYPSRFIAPFHGQHLAFSRTMTLLQNLSDMMADLLFIETIYANCDYRSTAILICSGVILGKVRWLTPCTTFLLAEEVLNVRLFLHGNEQSSLRDLPVDTHIAPYRRL